MSGASLPPLQNSQTKRKRRWPKTLVFDPSMQPTSFLSVKRALTEAGKSLDVNFPDADHIQAVSSKLEADMKILAEVQAALKTANGLCAQLYHSTALPGSLAWATSLTASGSGGYKFRLGSAQERKHAYLDTMAETSTMCKSVRLFQESLCFQGVLTVSMSN
eukprot:1743508-Rhodomonas_salina.1